MTRSPSSTPSALSVDRLEIVADHEARAFDAYLMVDWSSSSRPTTGNDSIWIATGTWNGRRCTAEAPVNVATRVAAVEVLQSRLRAFRAEGRRVLVGFDFAFGYPAGFANALGLDTSAGAWRAVHAYFGSKVRDSPRNVHNRDTFAAMCNRRIGGPGPFWGCARSSASADLLPHRVGVFDWPHHGLAEWRATDLRARSRVTTQSVWKLNCGVAVGGQTILGIKHLHDLARAVDGRIWPFDGWAAPEAAGICFAEIFPSLIVYEDWKSEYRVARDRTQVQSCVRYAAERDRAGRLANDLRPPDRLDDSTLARVEDEEGWILWVSPRS